MAFGGTPKPKLVKQPGEDAAAKAMADEAAAARLRSQKGYAATQLRQSLLGGYLKTQTGQA